ncbi:MAG: ATP-binding protein, partial [Candidatus Diapherotrites archaeon]|nr:ATP-binding protein [Candidatus Diapherotrites archaeon]
MVTQQDDYRNALFNDKNHKLFKNPKHTLCDIHGKNNAYYNHNLFCNRDRELSVLKKIIEYSKNQKPDSAILTGESGVGKTFLANEFINSVKKQYKNVEFVYLNLSEFGDSKKFQKKMLKIANKFNTDNKSFQKELSKSVKELKDNKT